MAAFKQLAVELRQSPALLPFVRRAGGLLADRQPQQSPQWLLAATGRLRQLDERPCCAALQQHPALVQLLERGDASPVSPLSAEVPKASDSPALTAAAAVASPQSGSEVAAAAESETAEEPAEVEDEEVSSEAEHLQEPLPELPLTQRLPPLTRSPFELSERAAQGYYTKSRQLEETCGFLFAENAQLRKDLEAQRSRGANARELNTRLLGELKSLREEKAKAASEVERLSAELSELRQSLAAPPAPPAQAACPAPPPGLPLRRDLQPPGLEGLGQDTEYPRALLLAHLGLQQKIMSRRPPGLDECAVQPSPLGIRAVPLTRPLA